MSKIVYLVNNINCQKCANTILNSLGDEFGDIEVRMNTEPREVTVTLESKEQEVNFRVQMEEMGYSIIKEIKRS